MKKQIVLNSNLEFRAEKCFVGLKNLGATCYINAIIQQLFMNQTLRNFLLNCNVKVIFTKNRMNFLH